MNEFPLTRRWRVVVGIMVVVILALVFALFQSFSALNTANQQLTDEPSGSPTNGRPGDGATPGATPVPVPTVTVTAEPENPDEADSDSDNGSGRGNALGGRSGSGGGSGTGGGTVPFTVGGNAPGSLEPGLSSRINVIVTNTNSFPISVTSVTATLHSLSAPNATSSLPCTLADFDLDQLESGTTLAVPANSSRTLSQLGVPTADWPLFRMLNTVDNQDGCKGATIGIRYAASGVSR
jgi:hypothetical protein